MWLLKGHNSDLYYLKGYIGNMFVSYSCPRFDCKIRVSLSDLHGPSVVFQILLYFTSLPLWTCNYPTKPVFLNQGAIVLKALG